jgi:MarR family transcriptional regulator, organic hydroperoxide resistance regulator
VQLEELRKLWTKMFGIHGPQWMIVIALYRLDQGEGATVQAIADLLQMNPIFVTSHARFLESKELIRLEAAGENPGTMMLLITEKASRYLADLASPQKA